MAGIEFLVHLNLLKYLNENLQRYRTQTTRGSAEGIDRSTKSAGGLGGHYAARTQRVDLLDRDR
jgi:hypothetical protein